MRMLRLLLAAALVLAPFSDALAGAGTITTKDAGGITRTFVVTTDGSGNFVSQTVICDATAAATCAPVDASGLAVKATLTGTVPLPTGAATSALQSTGNTALTTINTTLGTPFQAGGSIGNTTFAVTQGTAASLNATVVGTGTFATQAAQSGTWNITNVSGTVSLPTGAATSANQTNASAKTQIVDGSGNVIAATSNSLNVQCANCSGSGASAADAATFTAGTSTFAPAGGEFTTGGATACVTGHQCLVGITAARAFLTDMSSIAGVATATGNGVVGTGVQRVAIASDNTAFAVNATLSAETTKVIGTVNVAAAQTIAVTQATSSNLKAQVDPLTAASWGIGTSTQNSTSVANGHLVLGQFNTTPTTISSGNMSALQMDNAGKLLVNCTGCSSSGAITSWGGGTLGAMANYGTSPGAVLVPGINAFVTNSNANGSAVSASSSPVVIASDQAAVAVKGNAANGSAVSGNPNLIAGSDGTNARTIATDTAGNQKVINGGSNYETIAASQTAQVMGPTGATGDYLSHCVIYPATTSPGVVTVFDNTNAAGTNVIVFAGGATSTSNLTPIAVPVGAVSTAGAWKVTTGTNVSAVCYGKFT